MENTIVSVSLLTKQISLILEEGIGLVSVQGEISNYKAHSSGHRYFTLKDEGAQISCTLWRSKPLNFQPSDGMKVIVSGNLTVYPPQGKYQIDCSAITPVGKGDLFLAYEALKKKLEGKGYFDLGRKRGIPELPLHIGISTSPTGAAVKDMLTTLERRLPACTVYFRPTLVQGEAAGEDIANAIEELQHTAAQVIIIGRGGGSLEDLWPYNTELVAEAIIKSKIPIISAVGHETDFTIADFVADARAATPTAAAELVTSITKEYIQDTLSSIQDNLNKNLIRIINDLRDDIAALASSYSFRRIKDKIGTYKQQADEFRLRVEQIMTRKITSLQDKVVSLTAHLLSLEPLSPLKRGFAILQADKKFIPADISLSGFKIIEVIRLKEKANVEILSVD